jgi:hypothetical protein
VDETDQAYGYTGGDPVIGTDPTGMNDGGVPLAQQRNNYVEYCDTHNDPVACGSCPPGTSGWNCFVAEWDPLYSVLTNTAAAYGQSQEQCAGNWAIFGHSLVAAAGLGAFFVGGIGGAAEEGVSTSDLLSNLASRAQTTVGEGSGPVYGTAVHTEFAADINALGDSNLSTEVSYLDHQVVPYGTPGSVRLDVVEGDLGTPTAAYDLKTGTATLTPKRIAQIQANLPLGYQNIPIIELRP